MIRTKNLTPEVYYKRSRDFQFLGRVYDIVFNYIKTTSDLVKESVLNPNTDDRLIDLICLTLGFKQMHNYNIRQLRAVCSVFMLAIRNKGSLKAIELAVYSILHAENISKEPSVQYDYSKNELSIYVPSELTDITLLTDVLDYIIPAGVSVNIYKKTMIDRSVFVDAYNHINTDSANRWSKVLSRNVSYIPRYSDIGDNITQADLGDSRLDSSVIPTYETKIDGQVEESGYVEELHE